MVAVLLVLVLVRGRHQALATALGQKVQHQEVMAPQLVLVLVQGRHQTLATYLGQNIQYDIRRCWLRSWCYRIGGIRHRGKANNIRR